MFNKETYIQRRNRLKKEIGKGILLFLGNNESGMNYTDNTYHSVSYTHLFPAYSR